MESKRGTGDKNSYTWFPSYSNVEVDLAADEFVALPIEDIAHSLSNKCRFFGHCKRFYSVAEHSVHMSYVVPSTLAFAGLMHDACESYVGDIPTQVKRLVGGVLRALEDKAIWAIAGHFQVPYEQLTDPIIKKYDLMMLGKEARVLMPPHPGWDQFPDNLNAITIECWDPVRAEQEFLKRFYELKDKDRS